MKRFLGLTLVIAGFAFLGVGCSVSNLATSVTPSQEIKLGGEWQPIDHKVSRLKFNYATTTGATMIVYRFSTDLIAMRFEQSTSARSVADWAKDFPNAVLVTNGVYFHDDFLPSGMLISKGQRIGSRVFDYDKSGIVELSPVFKIFDITSASTDLTDVIEAAQSYPFLIKDGKPALTKDSGLEARRTFIGNDRGGHAYLGIVPDASITLFDLMGVLKQIGVKWNIVLNLDGGPSSGLVANFTNMKEMKNSYTNVPNVIMIESKRQ